MTSFVGGISLAMNYLLGKFPFQLTVSKQELFKMRSFVAPDKNGDFEAKTVGILHFIGTREEWNGKVS